LKVEKQGWGWVRSGMYARIHMKRHFFKLDGKSLCGIHYFYQFSKMEEKQLKDDERSEEYCYVWPCQEGELEGGEKV